LNGFCLLDHVSRQHFAGKGWTFFDIVPLLMLHVLRQLGQILCETPHQDLGLLLTLGEARLVKLEISDEWTVG
jgi:hypothetical protein